MLTPSSRYSYPSVTPPLYRWVFTNALSSVVVLLLLTSILLQPLQAEADEVEATLTSTVTDAVLAEVSAAIAETDSLPTLTAEAVSPPVETLPLDEVSSEGSEVGANDTPGAETAEPPVTPAVYTDTGDGAVSPPLPQPDSDDEGGAGEPNESPPTAPTKSPPEPEPEAVSGAIATSSVPTTGEEASSTPLLTVESDMVIQFNKENCMAVDNGTFYCQQATTTTTADDGLFALPDADGDLEIYLKQNGELTQITHNQQDDAAPYYDPASDSIVWHRFINDRYQIIIYDVGSGTEEQLTATAANNMEPFRADNYITWQHWDNDAWQIMLYDGHEVVQLTKTRDHNLAPTVRNGLVVWSRIAGDQKTLEVYDMAARSYMTISDDEGGAISNPRMVLVYEAALDNGAVVTKGYDLVTGEITAFAATPGALPTDLPDPETTGETRALITGKNTEEDEREGGGSGEVPLVGGDDVATSSDALSLDLSVATSSVPVTAVGEYTLDLSTTTADFAVEVPPPASETIPDVVVPPFLETEAAGVSTVTE